jgi:CO/xanthine dehydrogenase FAD-binding subunit
MTPRYARPDTLDDALGLLDDGPWRMLAGGTDFYPAQGARPIRDNVLDLNGLGELRGIVRDADGVRIGARTSWSDIIRADLPPAFDGLKLAAREVGSVQIQNAGTIAGNLCNASPAADGVPPLLTLDASIDITSKDSIRQLPLTDFILGNRRTDLKPGELVTAIRVPADACVGRSSFLKLGARRYLVISIAMASARLTIDGGKVAAAALAVGSCSEVARRLPELERALVGRSADASIADCLEPAHLAGLAPIDDVRASGAYRLEAAGQLVARVLASVVGQAGRVAA